MFYIAATHRRLLRTALHVTVLLLVTATYVVSQPQTRSEDEAAADMKRRVVETLQLQPGQNCG
jgi:hypothetical protein